MSDRGTMPAAPQELAVIALALGGVGEDLVRSRDLDEFIFVAGPCAVGVVRFGEFVEPPGGVSHLHYTATPPARVERGVADFLMSARVAVSWILRVS